MKIVKTIDFGIEEITFSIFNDEIEKIIAPKKIKSLLHDIEVTLDKLYNEKNMKYFSMFFHIYGYSGNNLLLDIYFKLGNLNTQLHYLNKIKTVLKPLLEEYRYDKLRRNSFNIKKDENELFFVISTHI